MPKPSPAMQEYLNRLGSREDKADGRQPYSKDKDIVLDVLGSIENELVAGGFITASVRRYNNGPPRISYDQQDSDGNDQGKLLRRATIKEALGLSRLIVANEKKLIEIEDRYISSLHN
jgi:hypothetical protein